MFGVIGDEPTVRMGRLQVPWRDAYSALPAYACAFAVALSASIASASTINAPMFGSTVFMFAVLGLLSNYTRSVGDSKWLQQFGQAASLTLVILIPLYGFIIDPHRFFPPIVFEFRDYHPLALMTWVCVITLTVTGRWGDDEYAPLSFALLPSLAMVALSAPHNINIEVTVAALSIVIFGAFLLAYETTIMRASKTGDERALSTRSLLSFHLYSGAQWSLVILLASALLAPLFLLLRMPIAPPNTRLPVPRRYLMVAPEFTMFSRHMSLWGGPINLSPRKLFEIRGDYYPYWRAQVYDEYTGHGWQYNESEDEQIMAEQVGYGTYRFNVSLPPHPKIVNATVMAVGERAFVLLTPGVTLMLETLRPLPDLRLSHGGMLRAFKAEFSPHSYKIVAAVNDPPLDVIRNVKLTPSEFSDGKLLKYLWLPDIPTRVIDLARQIASGVETIYEKAMRIAEYLREHYRYSLSPPHVPMGYDSVDFFLFESREGACDFFASAHAVMCRAVGIPSRVVAGFMSDEYDSESRTLILRERDAHVWVEIYIPNHGWVIVDPTPPSRQRIPLWDIIAWLREGRLRIKWQMMQRLFLWVIGLLAIISAMPMLRYHWHKLKSGILGVRALGQRLNSSYAALVQELSRLGVHCEPHHTPLQIALMLRAQNCDKRLRLILHSASELLRRLSWLAYSPAGYDEASVAEFEAEAKKLIWKMRWHWLLASLRRLQRLLSVRRSRAQ